VTPVAEELAIEDLGSLNGTFVDGERISGKVILRPNADVKLGTTHFRVEAPAASAPLVRPGDRTVMSDVVSPEKERSPSPLPQAGDRTVVRDQPAPAGSQADTASDQPLASVPDRTVVRDQPAETAIEKGTADREAELPAGTHSPVDQPGTPDPVPPPESDKPGAADKQVAPMVQPTVVQSEPPWRDVGKTVVRDQPISSISEPTVVRDVAKGIPGAPPSAGGAAGGPPGSRLPRPLRGLAKLLRRMKRGSGEK
jgi:hypothetical protein